MELVHYWLIRDVGLAISQVEEFTHSISDLHRSEVSSRALLLSLKNILNIYQDETRATEVWRVSQITWNNITD